MVTPSGGSGLRSTKQIAGGGRVVRILQGELRECGEREDMVRRDLHGLLPIDLGFREILHLCVIHPPQIADVRMGRRQVRGFLQMRAGVVGFICAKIFERFGYFLFRVGRENGRAGRRGSSGRGGFRNQSDGKLLTRPPVQNLHVLGHPPITGGNDLQRVACGREICKLGRAATENTNACGGARKGVEIDDCGGI